MEGTLECVSDPGNSFPVKFPFLNWHGRIKSPYPSLNSLPHTALVSVLPAFRPALYAHRFLDCFYGEMALLLGGKEQFAHPDYTVFFNFCSQSHPCNGNPLHSRHCSHLLNISGGQSVCLYEIEMYIYSVNTSSLTHEDKRLSINCVCLHLTQKIPF